MEFQTRDVDVGATAPRLTLGECYMGGAPIARRGDWLALVPALRTCRYLGALGGVFVSAMAGSRIANSHSARAARKERRCCVRSEGRFLTPLVDRPLCATRVLRRCCDE